MTTDNALQHASIDRKTPGGKFRTKLPFCTEFPPPSRLWLYLQHCIACGTLLASQENTCHRQKLSLSATRLPRAQLRSEVGRNGGSHPRSSTFSFSLARTPARTGAKFCSTSVGIREFNRKNRVEKAEVEETPLPYLPIRHLAKPASAFPKSSKKL